MSGDTLLGCAVIAYTLSSGKIANGVMIPSPEKTGDIFPQAGGEGASLRLLVSDRREPGFPIFPGTFVPAPRPLLRRDSARLARCRVSDNEECLATGPPDTGDRLHRLLGGGDSHGLLDPLPRACLALSRPARRARVGGHGGGLRTGA